MYNGNVFWDDFDDAGYDDECEIQFDSNINPT